MARDSSAAFAWCMLLQEMSDIEVGEAFTLQILSEAVATCASAGITVEELTAFADAQNLARDIIPVRTFNDAER